MSADQLKRILKNLDPQSSTFAERHDVLMNEAMETGGAYAQRDNGQWLLDIHGVRVTSETEDGAQRLWLRIAATQTNRQHART